MSTSRLTLVALASLALGPLALAAQSMPERPRFGGPEGGPPPPGAEFLLANTGRLQLTDQQVVKLAALARRSFQRRAAMRARADSTRAERVRRPGAEPAGPPAGGERPRDQARADLAEAIAVLTPEQQAQAWELVAGRGRGERAYGRTGWTRRPPRPRGPGG